MDEVLRRSSRILVVLLVSVLVASGCGADEPARARRETSEHSSQSELRVAAAASLKFALDHVIVAFQEAHPHILVQPTYGSSGNFYAQLTHKAPFDVFLSADSEYPNKLVADGLARDEFLYGSGQIVVWTAEGSGIDVEKLRIDALTDPRVKKIAIANPKVAPYGRAAETALKQLGTYDEVKDRLVLAENITQAAQFAETGAANVGIISLSLALAPQMKHRGSYWVMPLDAYPHIEHAGVILKWAIDPAAAETFKAFLLDKRAHDILQRYGFEVPES